MALYVYELDVLLGYAVLFLGLVPQLLHPVEREFQLVLQRHGKLQIQPDYTAQYVIYPRDHKVEHVAVGRDVVDYHRVQHYVDYQYEYDEQEDERGL